MSEGPERTERRFFWGNSLPQAIARAARQHQLAPEALAWRRVEKRHGFVKQPRRVLIEVDPAAPRREEKTAGQAPTRSAEPAKPARPAERARRSEPAESAEPARSPARAAAPRTGPASPSPAVIAPAPVAGRGSVSGAGRRGPAEPSDPPDEESALAAAVAMGRLLGLAGLALEVRVTRGAERLEVELSGTDGARLGQLGIGFLDDLAFLLPRLVRTLSGRQVLCRVDGAGLRTAREAELTALARKAADQVLATGEPQLLEPLPPAERRVIHVFLADEPGLETESLGQGVEKPMRIFKSPGGRGPIPS